jgi:hypothetical protein
MTHITVDEDRPNRHPDVIVTESSQLGKALPCQWRTSGPMMPKTARVSRNERAAPGLAPLFQHFDQDLTSGLAQAVGIALAAVDETVHRIPAVLPSLHVGLYLHFRGSLSCLDEYKRDR